MATVKLPWKSVDVVPEAQRSVLVDGWGTCCPSILQDCECPEVAPFRLPSARYSDVSYACSVRITGRVAQRRPYSDCLWVRVAITFVGEEQTVVAGWMAV